jgi:hypothetical protein
MTSDLRAKTGYQERIMIVLINDIVMSPKDHKKMRSWLLLGAFRDSEAAMCINSLEQIRLLFEEQLVKGFDRTKVEMLLNQKSRFIK